MRERETVRAASLNREKEREREKESFYLYGCFFRTYFIKLYNEGT